MSHLLRLSGAKTVKDSERITFSSFVTRASSAGARLRCLSRYALSRDGRFLINDVTAEESTASPNTLAPHIEHRADVGMTHRRKRPGFAREVQGQFRVSCDMFGRRLSRAL
jgi:hypothetical protein